MRAERFEAAWRHQAATGMEISCFVMPLELTARGESILDARRPNQLGSGVEDILIKSCRPAGDDYATLGVAALKETRAEFVFCLGGGDCVVEECRRAQIELSDPPIFEVWPISRWSNGGPTVIGQSDDGRTVTLEKCGLTPGMTGTYGLYLKPACVTATC